jgi:hypothetical protein
MVEKEVECGTDCTLGKLAGAWSGTYTKCSSSIVESPVLCSGRRMGVSYREIAEMLRRTELPYGQPSESSSGPPSTPGAALPHGVIPTCAIISCAPQGAVRYCRESLPPTSASANFGSWTFMRPVALQRRGWLWRKNNQRLLRPTATFFGAKADFHHP